MAAEGTASSQSEGPSTSATEASGGARRPISLGLLVLLLAVLSRVSRYARDAFLVWGETRGEGRFMSWDIEMSKLLMLLAFYVFAAGILSRPRLRFIRIDTPLKILTLFGVLGVVSLAWAYDPAFGLPFAIRMFQYIGVYFLVLAFTLTWDDLHHWGHLFFFAALLNLGGTIQERIAPVLGVGGVAGTATISWITIYPCWALLFLPFAIHYLLWGRNRVERCLGGLGILINLATIVISFRRAGPLGVAVILAVYLALIGWRHRVYRRLVLITVLAGILALALIPGYSHRLASIPFLGSRTMQTYAWYDRLILYKAGLKAFQSYPFLGLGVAGPTIWIRDVYGYQTIFEQHNLFLAIGAEVGVVGLTLYGLFLVTAGVRALRAFRNRVAAGDMRGASLVAAILSSFVVMIFYAQFQILLRSIPIYLAAALGSAAYEIVRGASGGRHRIATGSTETEPPLGGL